MLRGTGVTGREIGFKNLMVISTPSNSPYIEKQVVTVVRLYNPDYGDKRVFICGHGYERHFDPYEDPDHQAVGCKYCGCYDFKEA